MSAPRPTLVSAKAPAAAPVPPTGDRWRWLWGYYRRHRWALGGLALLGALQSLVYVPTLHAVRHAFDVVVPQGRVDLLLWIGAGLAAIRLIAAVLTLYTRRLSLNVSKTATYELRTDLLKAIYGLSASVLARQDAGRVHTRVVMETERLDNILSGALANLLPALLTTAVLGLVLIYLNLWLVLAVSLLAPLMWLGTKLSGRYVQREVRVFQNDFEDFSQGVHFVLRQFELTRARGFEDEELMRQAAAANKLKRSGVGMAMSFALQGQIHNAITGLAALVLLIGGGVAVIGGSMSLGDLMAFYLAAGALNASLVKLMTGAPEVISAHESLGRLETLRLSTTPPPYVGTDAINFQGRIELKGVVFSYDERLLLDGLDLTLSPGANVAILGPNGAGKSTIVQIVLGLQKPQAGQVLADGRPYETLDLRALRRSIGFVPQRPTFFTGSVRDNLAYGWPGLDDAALQAAIERACAGDLIARLPEGLESLIGEGGALISGGEAQRLAIARALLGAPRLLILDEPTNHLDVEAIGTIMRGIAALPDRPAILTISHDPLATALADEAFVLRNQRLLPMLDRKSA